jgi:hypothetical protein
MEPSAIVIIEMWSHRRGARAAGACAAGSAHMKWNRLGTQSIPSNTSFQQQRAPGSAS